MQLDKYLAQTENSEIKAWINGNLRRFLQKNAENQGEIEHIIDYMNSDVAPNRLQKMSYSEACNNAKKWVAAMIKRGNRVLETESDTETVFDFDNGVKLVKLISRGSYEREGSLMSHCVASYYGKSGCEIYSLRDSKNQPHVTIELIKKDEQIQQIKGKGNGSIHPKYIKYVLISLEKLGMKIRSSEMTYLGYDNLDDSYWKYLEANFTGIQFICMRGVKYFYRYSKLVTKNDK